MNISGKLTNPSIWILASLVCSLVLVDGCGNDRGSNFDAPTNPGMGTGAGGLGNGPSSVDLGAAGNYVILAQTEITDVPASDVTGNIGLSPATGAAIGITCAEVTGVTNAVDAAGPLPCSITDPV
jgi:hypothetical protein